MEKYVRICQNLDETRKLAQDFASLVQNGCFINLYGEIGAGKTAFVKLVADALGVQEKVTSPSFVILNEYHSAKLPIYHFDLYRLEEKGLKSKLIMQIHDELIIEAYENEIEEVKNILINCMENAIKLNVPLKVDSQVGASWYETK